MRNTAGPVGSEDAMANQETFHVRPAGRHLLTIGRDLIQDQYAAVVELVKNAYDADSPDVNVAFRAADDKQSITITVEDHGHGMARETVLKSWMVPSTTDKLRRGTSANGRVLQGRKGIGRYAAAILGHELLLETVASQKKTTVLLDWKEFDRASYLDDVDVLVETKSTSESDGTRLTIRGDAEHLHQWTSDEFSKLEFELRKLISPLAGPFRKSRKPDKFEISLTHKGIVTDGEEQRLVIVPFPVADLFDYRIHGEIHQDGKGVLTYESQKARNTISERIKIDLEEPTRCGSLRYDLRVYDREPKAIEQLIERGLKDEQGDYLGRLQAKQLLNELNGIGVYRNGFRIRPLGDPQFDWLELNKARIQEPAQRIGSNQVIGLVEIEAEELSDLQEKSARDGLRDNFAFNRLKAISKQVIQELEERRYVYRSKAGLSRGNKKVAAQLETLYGLDQLRQRVRRALSSSGIPKATQEQVDALLLDEEQNKSRVYEELKEIVAVYQGHATLGKIMNVVLHEARRPLNFFKNQIPNLTFWAGELKTSKDPSVLEEILEIAPGMASNSTQLVELFNRLDPLAAAKRGPQRDLLLHDQISRAFRVFENELLQNHIICDIQCARDVMLHAWEQDIAAIFTNLIDNSIYWMTHKKRRTRKITLSVTSDLGRLKYIDYRDSGPGIEPHLIESGVIFEPEFSTKPPGEGHGLGLAIAGEAASRNGLELKAFASDEGAYFRLQCITGSGGSDA